MLLMQVRGIVCGSTQTNAWPTLMDFVEGRVVSGIDDMCVLLTASTLQRAEVVVCEVSVNGTHYSQGWFGVSPQMK